MVYYNMMNKTALGSLFGINRQVILPGFGRSV